MTRQPLRHLDQRPRATTANGLVYGANELHQLFDGAVLRERQCDVGASAAQSDRRRDRLIRNPFAPQDVLA